MPVNVPVMTDMALIKQIHASIFPSQDSPIFQAANSMKAGSDLWFPFITGRRKKVLRVLL